ncbi:unnamed protein product [Schistosoma rodhaini]|uniref:H/ACA ribonucleoprotein complex non-core subunit NAF1 n=1 Tax=Schistosoma rodhaini TaxID=6188 RepID=A0AA85GMB4_9TREM|nr:unnamed protein product [Schistosoma rodhaini]
MLDTADEPVSTVNSSPKNMDKLKLLSRNYETSSSSDISSDSEPELIEKPVIQKPKDPAFLIPPDYILQSVKDLTADIKVSLLGKISQVFDKYVVIRSINSAVVLNERSVLFLEDGKHLGEVYETFGPVRTPFYLVILSESFCVPELRNDRISGSHNCTLSKSTNYSENLEPQTPSESVTNTQLDNYNSPNDSNSQNRSEIEIPITDNSNAINYEEKRKVNSLLKEVSVFYAPDMPELTIPVFYNQLIASNIKGSDASWVGDTEPPPEALEFSDDEREKLHKRALKMKRKSQTLEPTNSAQMLNQPKKQDQRHSKPSFGVKKHQTAFASCVQPIDRAGGYSFQQQSCGLRPCMPIQPLNHWDMYPSVQPQWQNSTYGRNIWPSYPPTVQNSYPYIPRDPMPPQPFPCHYPLPEEPYQQNSWSPYGPL